MTSTASASLFRCLAVGAVVTAAYGVLTAWLLPTVVSGDTGTFDAALVRCCAGLAVLAAGWLWVGVVATVLAALRGRERYAVRVPAPLRRAVLTACGVALAGGLAVAPAHATPGHPHEDRVTHPAAVVSGLPLPDRADAPPSVVVVAPGDSLWAIAARDLGPGATDAEIDAHWRRLYDLNRAEIGPDPDLIRPALRLEVLP